MRKIFILLLISVFAFSAKAIPTLKLVSPYATPDSGWVVRGAVSFTVNASSSLPITKVEFYVDNVLKSTDTTYPYSYLWNTRSYSAGVHTLKAIAYDTQSSATTLTQTDTVKAPLALKATTNAAVTAKLLPAMTALISDVSLRDVSICLGADNSYYLVGSMSDNNIWCRNEGVNLWRSPDMKAWTYVGLIWSFEGDATTSDKTWNLFYNQQFRAVWNTRIRYTEENYYLSFGNPVMGSRLLKSTSGKPEGPYAYQTLESNLLKTTIFSDTINKNNLYYSLVNSGYYFEYKKNKYISTINVNDTTKRYSSYVGIIDSTGNFGNWHEALPCGGNATYFTDTQGSLWATFFGNDDAAPWRERAGIVKMDVDITTGKLKVATDQSFPPIVIPNGINQTDELPDIRIFPNPATLVLTIENAENAIVSVFNISGVAVAKMKCTDSQTRLDVSSLKSGLYLVSLEKNGLVTTRKVSIIN